jgi:hypothetical protein
VFIQQKNGLLACIERHAAFRLSVATKKDK